MFCLSLLDPNMAQVVETLHYERQESVYLEQLTHWGGVTHICVSKLTIIASDNGSSPDWRQAIIWTNAGILLIGPLGTNFSEILIAILTFSFKKMHLKVSSAKRRPFCLGLNVLTSEMLMIRRYKEPGHWQTWYWHSCFETFPLLHQEHEPSTC